ncbi:MAG: peptide-methionine (S)-S-oxide reductase [Burkholderiales bacterium]|nr:MAG: peptide-methionine (S)-S-oxide reductase [Burkholderiales bacterium]
MLAAIGLVVGGLAVLGLAAVSPHAAAQTSTPAAANTARATFAGGCFWCVEADFDKVPGVLSTTSGYIGGRTPNPTYEQVSRNTTGHAEAVEIVFDPTKVSYETLLAKYWRSIDPTTVDRQFCDSGSPYRTAIFANDAAQLEAARRSLAELQRTKPFAEPIVTRIEQAGPFYPAEAYHQDYYLKNPVRYRYYRSSCGRDARLEALWGRP